MLLLFLGWLATLSSHGPVAEDPTTLSAVLDAQLRAGPEEESTPPTSSSIISPNVVEAKPSPQKSAAPPTTPPPKAASASAPAEPATTTAPSLLKKTHDEVMARYTRHKATRVRPPLLLPGASGSVSSGTIRSFVYLKSNVTSHHDRPFTKNVQATTSPVKVVTVLR
jgi:hypothetical protein